MPVTWEGNGSLFLELWLYIDGMPKPDNQKGLLQHHIPGNLNGGDHTKHKQHPCEVFMHRKVRGVGERMYKVKPSPGPDSRKGNIIPVASLPPN